MAAYNAEATIDEAIGSALAQTYADWELLVVDDGSSDETAQRVRAVADPRVRLIESPHLGVLAQVRNRGIEEATGELIALLDADDVWLPGKLAAQERVFRERREVGVVHTGANLLVDGELRQAPPSAPPPGPLLRGLLLNNHIYSSSAVVRRSLLDEHGAFRDHVPPGVPDYDLWLRIAPYTEFVYLPEPLLLYRVHGGQLSSSRRGMELAALLALENAAAARPDLVAGLRTEWLVAIGKRKCLAGEPGLGRRELLAALAHRPWSTDAWRWLARGAVAQLLRRTVS